MKKAFFIVMICVMGIVGFVAFRLLNESERRTSPQASANFWSDKLKLEIDYSKPVKKGKIVFGRLVKYDEYWQTGTEEATEITFGNDVIFGGEEVTAGRYRLYSIPGREEWQIVLNSELKQWGAFEPDRELDVVKVQVRPYRLNKAEEQLVLDFEPTDEGAYLVIKWGHTGVKVPIR